MRNVLYLVLLSAVMLAACEPKTEKLVIFHAGSLSIPFQELADTFESRYPHIDVQTEADGSIACARKITELNRKADIMASADISIIEQMLLPEYTNEAVAFAGNEMVLAYHESSPGKDSINTQNWPQILLHPSAHYGRSNPNLDPCGYRSIFSMRLQEKYLSTTPYVELLLAKDKRFIRPKETDLLALLETKTIDYMFIYRSVAQQHQLSFIRLNDTVNLGNQWLDSLYHSVSVEIDGASAGEKMKVYGSSMTYGICQLQDAPNPEAAEQFIKLLSSNTGKAIISRNGQTSLIQHQ